MTREEWDAKWWEVYREIWARGGRGRSRAFELAHEHMEEKFGRRPDPERDAKPQQEGLDRPGLFDWINLGLKLRKLEMIKPSVGAVAAAIAAAASAFGAAYAVATGDGIITSVEWIAVVWAAASALIAGLFQSPSKNV